MKLRTKLLLSVGLLLLAMALMIYIVPAFFIRKEVYQTADEIHDLLIKDHQQLVRSQQIWLKNVLNNMEQNNNSILFMLDELPKITSQLTFSEKETNASVWNALTHIASYDPTIGFVQLHDTNKNKAALIRVSTANLYPVKKISDKNAFVVISITPDSGEKTQDHKEFIGIPLPKEMQEREGVTMYALVSSERATQELPELQQEKEWLLKGKKEDAMKEGEASSFTWAMKIGMIRELTPFYSLGLAQKQGNSIVPEGLARLDRNGTGYAILTNEVFSTAPLFDDAEHFKQHHLNSAFGENIGLPTVSSAPAMVLDSQTHSAYMGNTLRLGDQYLSLGASLNSPAQQLALATNKTILLQVKKSFWLGYDGEGSPIRKDTMDQILSNLTSLQIHDKLPSQTMQKKGAITAQKFYFGMISSLYHGNLVFYDFHSMGGEESIVNTLLALENQLSSKISLQLLLIAIGAMILILFLVARMAFTIINPITKLAAATQKVASGRYGEVVLPDMDQRQDEVAILTHSFADMVRGLQDREKIRGVLDKVVSKEVADEILKTQIQLGGEDRVVTMLFSDIRGFTHISSQFSPQKTIKMLNECMDRVSRVIEGEGGVIDKYVGDEVMAIFGAPTTTQDHALRAVSAGILIIETLKKWNEEREAAGEMIIQMGVGIHTGLVVAGNMGAADRLNYTVVGAHVNLAERLCEVAKPNQLIISAATLAEPNIENSFYVAPLSPIIPKGLTEPIQIYEITGFKWEQI